MPKLFLGTRQVTPAIVTNISEEPNIERLEITPSTATQEHIASSGVDGYSPVVVNPVTASIDENIKPSNILKGVTILGVDGDSDALNGDTLEVTPTTSEQVIEPTSPRNGFTQVTVSPVTSSVDPNIASYNIKGGVEILGVTGTYGGVPVVQSKSITPTTSQQVITAPAGVDGYSPITVGAVTSSIDSNIKAENIINGVTILGVTGNYISPKRYGATIDNYLGETINGELQKPETLSTLNFAGVQTIAADGFRYGLYSNRSIQSVSFPDLVSLTNSNSMYMGLYNASVVSVEFPKLTTISGSNACYQLLYNSQLKSLSFPKLETISGSTACYYMCGFVYSYSGSPSTGGFNSVSLPKLTTISGSSACSYMFYYCQDLSSVSLPELTTISGSSACSYMFGYCTRNNSSPGLVTITFPKLREVTGSSCMSYMFSYTTRIQHIYFPALRTTSFGSNVNQFNNMMQNTGSLVTHTIHLPSNLQSTIAGLTGYPLFGGTSGYVVLSFDLPATS